VTVDLLYNFSISKRQSYAISFAGCLFDNGSLTNSIHHLQNMFYWHFGLLFKSHPWLDIRLSLGSAHQLIPTHAKDQTLPHHIK